MDRIEMELTGKKLGPYLLIEPLGRGGMGVVWRARHESNGDLVALKTVRVPNAGLLGSIRREIHCLARLEHPGIVSIFDEGLHEGLPWYAMERIAGQTLREATASRRSGPGAGSTWRQPPGQRKMSSDETRRHEATTEVQAPASAGLMQARPLPRTSSRGTETELSPLAGQTSEPSPARSEVRAAPGAPSEGLQGVLTLVRKLCGALAYLHGEGLAHRDLKPDNVLVRPDGTPVLVDFGLALRLSGEAGRDALELSSKGAGTLAYMAPEQIRGESLDARTDLYALGCILYELLTGSRPFTGRTSAELLHAQLKKTPAPPSELVAGLPPQLDELVLGLLQKNPRQRLGHADDVAASLAQLGAGDWQAGSAPAARAYLYRPELAGRKAALAEMLGAVDRLVERAGGGLLLVGGESGVGKTRLVVELAQRVDPHRVCVLTGECLPGAATRERPAAGGEDGPAARLEASGALHSLGGPLHPLRRALQAVADRCRAAGAAETQRLLGQRGALLALYEPTLQGLPGQVEAQDLAPLPADAARQRLYSDLTETLAAMAEEQPAADAEQHAPEGPEAALQRLGQQRLARGSILLVLDDLQWADELTLGWLDFLVRSRRLERLPLLVLGTYRSEELRPPLQSLLEQPQVQHVSLDRLGERAIGEIVGGMLAMASPPEGFVRFLARQSEGNPFFVAEYLRAAVAEGLLWRDTQGSWQRSDSLARLLDGAEEPEAPELALALPRSLRALVGRRLEGLSASALRLLRAAAVAGREIRSDVAGLLSGLGSQELLEATAELIERSVLDELPGQRLRFAHDKLREVAYEGIDPAACAGLHRAAAEIIEQLPPAEQAGQHAHLGQHWELAGVPERARPAYLGAARQARDRWALKEAGLLYRAYLALEAAPSPESLAARGELAQDVLRAGGRLGEAEAEQQRVLEEARHLGLRDAEALSLRRLATLKQDRGAPEAARELLEQAFQIHRETGERREAGIDLGNLAITYQDLGQMEEAKDLFHLALTIHRAEGNLRSEATVLGNLGSLHFTQGRIEEALQLYERAVDLHREMGNRWQEGIYLTAVAGVYHQFRQWARAEALYLQSLQRLREIGARRDEGHVLSHMALMYLEQGRLDAAEPLFLEALEIHRKVGDAEQEGFTLTHFAVLCMSQGQVQEARASLNGAVARMRDLGFARLEATALLSLAVLLRRCGGPQTEIETALGRAEALCRKIGDPVSLGACICEQGRMSLAAGRSAWRQIEEAAGLLGQFDGRAMEGLQEDLVRLQRAEAAFEADEPLFRGELIEDLPAALRQGLHEAGQLGR